MDGVTNLHTTLKMQEETRKRLTRAEYASYYLFPSDEVFNPLLYGRDLFQMFCAEYAVRILRDRVDWARFNQKTLRADKYTNVDDQMRRQSEERGVPIGRKIILPSSVTGSPRWEAEQFHDVMTMLMELERPDIFLTMTCNPEWKEITKNLLPGQRVILQI